MTLRFLYKNQFINIFYSVKERREGCEKYTIKKKLLLCQNKMYIDALKSNLGP